MTTEDKLRVDALIESMTARLRPLCAEWPEAVFRDMVRKLAEVTVRYEGTSTQTTYDRRSTERLVVEMNEMLDRSVAARDHDPGSDKQPTS